MGGVCRKHRLEARVRKLNQKSERNINGSYDITKTENESREVVFANAISRTVKNKYHTVS